VVSNQEDDARYRAQSTAEPQHAHPPFSHSRYNVLAAVHQCSQRVHGHGCDVRVHPQHSILEFKRVGEGQVAQARQAAAALALHCVCSVRRSCAMWFWCGVVVGRYMQPLAAPVLFHLKPTADFCKALSARTATRISHAPECRLA